MTTCIFQDIYIIAICISSINLYTNNFVLLHAHSRYIENKLQVLTKGFIFNDIIVSTMNREIHWWVHLLPFLFTSLIEIKLEQKDRCDKHISMGPLHWNKIFNFHLSWWIWWYLGFTIRLLLHKKNILQCFIHTLF